jgi:ABC-type dipeptide/oligopeptide/nickel transport system permease subunit
MSDAAFDTVNPAAASPSRRPWVRALLADRLAVVGFVIVALLVIVAVWPVQWLPADPSVTSLVKRLRPPIWLEGGTWANPLGTDGLGRDILSRMMLGTRYSLLIATLAVAITAGIGVTLGLIAGYFGGRVDSVIMRLVDIQLAFPLLLLIIAVIAVLGASLPVLIVMLGISGWAQYARLVRAETLKIKGHEYVEASRAIGNDALTIIWRHVLPNASTTIVVFGTFEFARILLLESAVSFLGLGVQPPTPSWGTMIADGRDHIFGGWWVSAIPGLAIVLAVLAFNFVGDGLRDVLDPRGHAGASARLARKRPAVARSTASDPRDGTRADSSASASQGSHGATSTTDTPSTNTDETSGYDGR